MIKNALLVALRTLFKNKTYAFLNITGLAVGLSCVITIFIVVRFELSFDNFHKDATQIYRVISGVKTTNFDSQKPGVSYPFAEAFKIEIPNLEQCTILIGGDNLITIVKPNNNIVHYQDKKGLMYAGPEFFKIFNFKWLYGNPMILRQPGAIALNKSTADQYFGNWQNAIGQTIQVDHNKVYSVRGIIQDPPKNTDFQFKIIVPYVSLPRLNGLNDVWSNRQDYVKLPPNMSKSHIEKLLSEFASKNYENSISKHYFYLEPLSDVHHNSNFLNFIRRSMPIAVLLILIFIGGFLLVIACINYINLSTAQAYKRGKEIGVRKVLGSSKGQLVLYYICETFLITVFAVTMAIGLSFLFLPFIKSLIGIPDTFSGWDVIMALFIFCVIVFCTTLSGLYPALVISKFNPISSLKNQVLSHSGKSINVQKGLVILQFSI